jgi:hypothetical protein
MTGGKVTLRVTTFEAVLDINAAAVVRGDYWLVELRAFAPEGERIRLVKETPVGILHHYCTLVVANGDAIQPLSDADTRKLSFPVLADLPADHVGFDNNCAKLYGTAENVQEALDNLCSISADDIGFTSNCPVLYDDAKTVQEALDALCNIDFSVQDTFRHLFDWGVVCGTVPKLFKKFGGNITITPGAYLDRSGKFNKFEGVKEFDLNTLKLGKQIVFESLDVFIKALGNGEVCLALAAGDGGKTTIHLIPEAIAYGPADPGFGERVRDCVEKKQIIKVEDLVAKLPDGQKATATKILLASSADRAFAGTAKLNKAEFAESQRFREVTVDAFAKLATDDEVILLKDRIGEAERAFPTGNLSGAALEVRQMQQAVAVFAAFQESDQERLLRCACENLFPTCPPNPGAPPYFVPIACLRGLFDGGMLLQEVCPYCCRKQAMTWRSLQYFIGEMRGKVAKTLERICCAEKKEGGAGPVRDPGRFTKFDLTMFADDFKLVNTFIDRPEKLPTDFKTKVDVANLSSEDARTMLRGTGIDVAETVDINDPKAFDIIQSKVAGIGATDILYSAGEVRPGDKVALLVQEGVARGYVLLARGSGRLPFERAGGLSVVTDADKTLADKLIRDVAAVRTDIAALSKTREALVTGIGGLRDEIVVLTKERDDAADSLKTVRTELDELARTREALSGAIESARKDLLAADESRKAILDTLRNAQPVNVVLGNRADIIAKLAGEGITTLADIAALTPATMKKLERAGILTEAELSDMRKRAAEFIRRG